MVRILVADKLDEEVLGELRARDDIAVDVKTGLSEDELAEIVGNYDGMIIRSGVKVTAKVLSRPGRLKAIARAGVGVDNVDIDAATKAGILVMNTPDANTISTAEHAFALMLAIARKIPQACEDTKKGNWNRSKFVGRQLAGKCLGIIGLGRVGKAVAERALGFRMDVIAYDPLYSGSSALSGKVRVVDKLDDLLQTADFISLHAPLTEQTRNMIGKRELSLIKQGAFIINCARGALIDLDALEEALKEGKVAGAALDVFPQEPPGKLSIFDLENVVVTCHLGASTKEAQLAVARDAAMGLLDYLTRGVIKTAVNVPGLPATLTEMDRAYVDLAERMGRLLSPLTSGKISSVQLIGSDPSLEGILPLLLRASLVGLLSPFLDVALNTINAEVVAREHNIHMGFSLQATKADERASLSIRIESASGPHYIEGRIDAEKNPVVLNIDGYKMQMIPEGLMLILVNLDRPGVIGLVGTAFGEYGVNIADLTLSRQQERALMVLKLDEMPPRELIDRLRKEKLIQMVALVELPSLSR